MLIKEFNLLVKSTLSNCVSVMCKKSAEYASGSDKLHNFKTAGRMRDISPELALDGMMLKHSVSLRDIIEDTEQMGSEEFLERYSRSLVDEKIGDSINYLLLLKALLYERLS
jgi:hypothetical protein